MASDRVDRENKIIRGYAVMSLGDAEGHGFGIDETTLNQVVELGNAAAAAGGMKTRVRHPNSQDDGFARYLGQSTNFRREGDKAVADLSLSPAAFVAPGGDLGTYIMARADEGGSGFGASPEIEYTLERIGRGAPVARLKSLKAIAIVDDPATNKAFFSCLSAKEPDMAETAELETKLADLSAKQTELTAERDLLTKEVGTLKASVAKLEADAKAAVEVKTAELSKAKTDAMSGTLTAERARVADILALCSKANRAELAAKYVTEGTATNDVQRALLEVLCAANKPIGEGSAADLSALPDENAPYKVEYAKQKTAYLSAGVSEEEYVAMRRIDDSKDVLRPNPPAKTPAKAAA